MELCDITDTIRCMDSITRKELFIIRYVCPFHLAAENIVTNIDASFM